MRSILTLTLLCFVQILNAQLLPVPLEFNATRYGKVIPKPLELYNHPPFEVRDQHAIDSIFQCEEKFYQQGDSITKTSQCPYYMWPYPDTAILINYGFEHMVSIPLFYPTHRTEYYKYSKVNDSTWSGTDSLRSWREKQKWYLDKNGFTKRVEICSFTDSLMATFYYDWYPDGRIKAVMQVGIPNNIDLFTDTLPIGSFEFLYDEKLRLSAFCTHVGRPYQAITDSAITWSAAMKRIYADSFPEADFFLLIPPSSSLRMIVTYTYVEDKLTSVFHCRQFSGGTDTIFYDDQQRIDRVRSYTCGIKQKVTEFGYDNQNRIRTVRTIRNQGNEPDDYYTYKFEYGTLGKISNIVLPLDVYSGNAIRHTYHLVYRYGN